MPDPGTTDTQHILEIVREARNRVLSSVVIQIISSILYLVALFSFARFNLIRTRLSWIGTVGLAVGILGLCSDAFFHLLAYYMTAGDVTIQQDVVRVMEYMQTDALFLLIPILVPLFVGSLLLAIGLSKQKNISRIPALFCVTGFAMLFIGTALSKWMGIADVPYLVLIVFSVFAIAQILIGIELIRGNQPRTTLAFVEISQKDERNKYR
jgi:hypothetical protein